MTNDEKVRLKVSLFKSLVAVSGTTDVMNIAYDVNRVFNKLENG